MTRLPKEGLITIESALCEVSIRNFKCTSFLLCPQCFLSVRECYVHYMYLQLKKYSLCLCITSVITYRKTVRRTFMCRHESCFFLVSLEYCKCPICRILLFAFISMKCSVYRAWHSHFSDVILQLCIVFAVKEKLCSRLISPGHWVIRVSSNVICAAA